MRSLSNLKKDTFYANSLFLSLSRLTASAVGLLFWLFAAKMYDQGEVGIATTMISTATLVSAIALLGLGQSMIRYFPTYDRSKILGTSLRVTTYCSLIIGIAFLVATSWWAPGLVITGSDMAFFIILAVTTSIISITGFAFTAGRKAKYTFAQNLVSVSRVAFLAPFILFGALGILVSMTISSVLVIAYSAVILFRLGLKAPRIDWSFLRQSVWFSAGNYASMMLLTLPTLAMPLIVFGSLGAEEAAVYYMASSIAYAAAVIPNACSDSLFVEGSHGEQLTKNAIKSLKTSFLILIPLSIVLYLVGGWLLSILGSGYETGGTEVLRLMVISIFFYTFFVVIMSWAKVKKDMKGLIALSLVNCVATITLSYFLIGSNGVSGVGYAFIISYAISALVGVAFVISRRGPRLKTSNSNEMSQ